MNRLLYVYGTRNSKLLKCQLGFLFQVVFTISHIILTVRCVCADFSVLNVKNVWSDSRSVMSNSLRPHGLCSPWNSPGQNTGVGSLSLLQGISPTQGLNPGLLHCRHILYQLSHKGSPRILEWVTSPFSTIFQNMCII